MLAIIDKPVEYTHTRIKVATLAKAKKLVKKSSKYRNVAHLLDVLIDEAAK